MYHQHPCKCMNCSLHFIACSWHADWPHAREGEEAIIPVCPECGSDALLRWAPHEKTGQIFEVVPGTDHRALISVPSVVTRGDGGE